MVRYTTKAGAKDKSYKIEISCDNGNNFTGNKTCETLDDAISYIDSLHLRNMTARIVLIEKTNVCLLKITTE